MKDEWTMHLEHKNNNEDLWAYESTYRFNLNTTYYVNATRAGNDYRLRVYSDPGYNNLLEDSKNIKGAKDRYVPLPTVTLTLLRQQWETHYSVKLIILTSCS